MSGALIEEDECIAAGVDLKKLESLANRMERLGIEADKLGVHIFGGSGTGNIRMLRHEDAPLILYNCSHGCFDGGDGAQTLDDQGLLVGEWSG